MGILACEFPVDLLVCKGQLLNALLERCPLNIINKILDNMVSKQVTWPTYSNFDSSTIFQTAYTRPSLQANFLFYNRAIPNAATDDN